MGYVRKDLGPGYAAPVREADGTWLDLNEFPWANPVDAAGRLRCYPEPRPRALRAAFAGYLGVEPDTLLVTRGGDEVIELATRICAVPGTGTVVTCSPTFAMYGIAAGHAAHRVLDVPLLRDGGTFRLDVPGVLATLDEASLVCLCTPGNPTGQALDLDDVRRVLEAARGRCLVLVDEAYAEFGDATSATGWLAEFDNLVVLRTLSKAHALAGARCGALVAPADIVAAADAAQSPFPFGQLDADTALAALAPEVLATTRERVATIVAERDRVATALRRAGVGVLPGSQTNFLVVEGVAAAAGPRLAAAGIAVRCLGDPFADALRITVGTPEQNDAVLACLEDR